MRARHRHDQGFSLIELLVVIIIIGVLAGIAVPIFLGQRKKGVDASLQSDLNAAAKKAESLTADEPQRSTAFTATQFDASNEGFVASEDNVIQIAGSPSAGYCVRGINPNSHATNSTNAAFWFDSKASGMKPTVGTAPSGGACASASGWVTIG